MYEEMPVKKEEEKKDKCLIRRRERFGNAKVRFLLPPFFTDISRFSPHYPITRMLFAKLGQLLVTKENTNCQ